jgi:hypothetical protein
VPGRSKTVSSALAAAVMAAAAAAFSLWSPPGAGGPATAGSSPTVAVASPDRGRSAPGPRVGGRSAARGASPPPSATGRGPSRHTAEAARAGQVLVVGRAATLRPRGGPGASFACQAAASLRRACVVRQPTAPDVPASAPVSAVVVVLAPADDARAVRSLLDSLSVTVSRASAVVILGPLSQPSSGSAARNLPGVRTLALERDAIIVDPIAEGWVSARTAKAYLTPAGDQLTAAGHRHLAGRLATVLRDVAAL